MEFQSLKNNYTYNYIGDPLDEKYVKISLSKISPNAGDGAFAKTAVSKNTSFSIYTGNVIDQGRDFEELMNTQQKDLKEYMRKENNATKIIQYSDFLNKFRQN